VIPARPDAGAMAPGPSDAPRPTITLGPDMGAARVDADNLSPVADAPGPTPSLGPCGVSLTEIALYQGVKLVLARDGKEPESRGTAASTQVIEGRPALFRFFLTPGPGWNGAEATVRLTLTTPAGAKTYDGRRAITTASTDRVAASTVNVEIPGADITAGSAFSAEIIAPTSCRAAVNGRFPAAGTTPLRAVRTGVLRVRLVPVRYETDGSNRLPDTSDAQLARFRELLMAIYPVRDVEVALRNPVGTSILVQRDSTGWSNLLDAIRALRASDAPPSDVYYYGLTNPAATLTAYCNGSCTAGIAYRAPASVAAARAGVGVGFTGAVAVDSLAHEIGHQHGRLHTPCGTVKDPDPAYPHADGALGVWGYDARTRMVIDPTQNKDLMSYCKPRWVSDYTFQALTARSQAVNSVVAVPMALRLEEPGTAPAGTATPRWRVLLVAADGTTRWGLPADGPAFGDSESAEILDAAGAVIETIQVHRSEIPDTGESSVYVPWPRAGWHALRVRGAAPITFDAPSAVPPLTE
jgi:hypothetical protein